MVEIWPVIHASDMDQVLRCAGIAAAAGCAGTLLISMHGDDGSLDRFAPRVAAEFPSLKIGVNYLTLTAPYRNPGHWDIYAKQCPSYASAWQAAHPEGSTSARDGQTAFRIRGEPGNVMVMDERWDPNRPHPRESLKFRSVMGAMVYIMEELMQEPARS
jgi:hypothetical protein